MTRLIIVLLGAAAAATLRGPAPQEVAELTKAEACNECAKHAQYLSARGDECSCHATDINNSFANDATKKSTVRVASSEANADGNYLKTETKQVGASGLKSAFVWHCRPLGSGKLWSQC